MQDIGLTKSKRIFNIHIYTGNVYTVTVYTVCICKYYTVYTELCLINFNIKQLKIKISLSSIKIN